MGYDGYVTFEDFSNEASDVKIKNDLSFIKKIVDSIE